MPRTVLERIDLHSNKNQTLREKVNETVAAIDSFTSFVQRTCIPDFFYTGLSLLFDWVPFIAVLDFVNIEYFRYNKNDGNIFQLSKMYSLLSSTQNFWVGYFAVFVLLRLVLFLIEYVSDGPLNENDIKKCRNRPEMLKLISETYKSTVRIIKSRYFADILIIGTSHLSSNSAQQVGSIIEKVQPPAVVVELDYKRAQRLDACNTPTSIDTSYKVGLVKDLFLIKTFLDPITLFARLGTRCVSYFTTPGFEFTTAARTARKVKAKVVYGDQDITKTLESIRKSTPAWVAILINWIVFHTYCVPLSQSFSRVLRVFVTAPVTWSLSSVTVALVCWYLASVQLNLVIQIFTEQSKTLNGINRMGCILQCFGRTMPCIARILKKSDLKDVRDRTLINNTIKCSREYDASEVVVAVVGLAHMADMVSIFEKDIRMKTPRACCAV